jgi:ferrous iron transport protein B
MALLWAVPCAAILSIIPVLANIFFGWGTLFVMLGIFAVMVLHMMITAKVFGKTLVSEKDRTGMIMELPPYHKPKWALLFKTTALRAKDIFLRAFRVILVITVLFFCLTYTPDGNVENSVIYKVGFFIEPVTRFFGLGRQLFMAFIAAAYLNPLFQRPPKPGQTFSQFELADRFQTTPEAVMAGMEFLKKAAM